MPEFNRFLVAVTVVASVAQSGTLLSASELIGIVRGVVPGVQRGLYRIDQDNGAASFVATTSLNNPLDMASDTRPASFTMWTLDGFSQSQLFTVNPVAGSTTLVGNFVANGGFMESLAFDPSTGMLFGISDGTVLYSINRDTGASTRIGPTFQFDPFLAMACDNGGTLFGVSGRSLVKINPATAALTSGVQLAVDLADIAVRPEDNVMFGVSHTTKLVYTINTTTGAMTLVGAYDPGILDMPGLAFTAVPEPASVTILMVLVALASRRRSSRR